MPSVALELSKGGGDLMTRVSADEAGAANYVLKRDWRRERNDEVRREGDKDFNLSGGSGYTPVGTMTVSGVPLFSIATDLGLNKIYEVTADLGMTYGSLPAAAAAGNGWWAKVKRMAASAHNVQVRDSDGVTILRTLTTADETVLALSNGSTWQILGASGFPVAEKITLVFTARRDDGKTALIVGTATKLYRYFAFEDQASFAAGVYESGVYAAISDGNWLEIGSGFTTTNAHRWEAKNVGGYAVFNNGIDLLVTYHLDDFAVVPMQELREQGVAFVGTIEEIEGILVLCDIAIIHSDYLATVMAAVGYGGFANGQELHFDRVHYRVLWGDPKSPRRWGASVPGTMFAGSRSLTVDYGISSIAQGDAIRVVGAGAGGGDLLTTVLFKSAANIWILADEAQTAVAQEPVSLQDAATLICGRFDTLDVASPILRCVKFQDRLVLAKSTGFVLGEYTGDRAMPFIFQTIYSKDGETECLAWRWTLCDVGGEYLVYAGETEFYRFDLVTRRPKLHPKLSFCSDGFFTAAATAAQDDIFAAISGYTKEVWFVFPGAGSDKALALYYGEGPGKESCSTIGTAYSAAAMVEKPAAAIAHGAAEKWFVLGTSAGVVLQYGFDRTGPLLWTRRGDQYNCDLYPGYADFGDPVNEKHLSHYLLVLASQSPNSQVTVGFWGVRNPSEALAEQTGSPKVFTSPATQNIAYLHYLLHLVQERIRATGTGNVRIAKRGWKVGRLGGDSYDRR